MNKKKCALVVARYQEDIRWMSYLGRNWDVHVYNDGPELNPYFSNNFTVHAGDKVPTEASKYLQFICETYTQLDQYEWVVFTQADPFHHSPDFIGLLESKDHWKPPFQGLTHGYRPPPWHADTIREANTSYVNNFRLFCEPMQNDWTGLFDGRVSHIKNTTVSDFFDAFNAKQGGLNRWFGACFATTPEAIRVQPLEVWKSLHQHSTLPLQLPLAKTSQKHKKLRQKLSRGKSIQKLSRRGGGKPFGYFLEFAWAPLLDHNGT